MNLCWQADSRQILLWVKGWTSGQWSNKLDTASMNGRHSFDSLWWRNDAPEGLTESHFVDNARDVTSETQWTSETASSITDSSRGVNRVISCKSTGDLSDHRLTRSCLQEELATIKQVIALNWRLLSPWLLPTQNQLQMKYSQRTNRQWQAVFSIQLTLRGDSILWLIG